MVHVKDSQDDFDSGTGTPFFMCLESNLYQNVKVTANRSSRKAKPTTPDQQIANFEQKLLDLIGDPTIQYLLVPKGNALTRSLVDALHEVRRGLCY